MNEVGVKVLRATVIDGKDVFPGDRLRIAAALARRLAALGKVEEIRRGRPPKENGDKKPAGQDTADNKAEKDGVAAAATTASPDGTEGAK